MEKPLTEKGAILGTFQYMAPEQLEAKNTDARTDIFAFGAVLYEMLTGRKAFEGKSQASLISAIMKDDPPVMSTLQPMTPHTLEWTVKKCLAKEPDKRWQSAQDLHDELEFVAGAGSESGMPVAARPRSHTHLAWGLALFLAVVVAGIATWNLKPPAPRPVTRFPLLLPPGDQFTSTFDHVVALSPDGTHLVYVANDQLYLRAMDQMEAAPIRGTQGGMSPFFSPDGEWVGFYAGGQLRKVSVSGGAPVTLCRAVNPWGASWGADDIIVFGQGREGILKVSSAGGTPEVLVPMSSNEGVAHGPLILPDGKSLLFTIGDGNPFPNVNEGRWQISTGGGTRPLWGPGGRELFYLASGGPLMVVPVQTDPSFTAGSAEVLFAESYFTEGPSSPEGRTYDISPDGRRFLMINESEEDTSTPMSMTVVLNWFQELKRLVPVE